MDRSIEKILKPALDFKPGGVPLGPAGAGMAVAGIANGLTNAVMRRVPVGRTLGEAGRRAVSSGVLAAEAIALTRWKPVKSFVGTTGTVAALFLGAAALNQAIGALQADRPVPDVTRVAQNQTLRLLASVPGINIGASVPAATERQVQGALVGGVGSRTGA